MSNQHLFLFQIGPVQSFIAAARKTQDLYVGSHILSSLVEAGVEAAQSLADFEAIFPTLERGKVTGGSPNRFAFLSTAPTDTVATSVRKAIDARWSADFVQPVRQFLTNLNAGNQWQAVFDRQATGWMEFYWAAVPYNANDHRNSYARASAALAQRKYLRHFPQVEEQGIKCTLTGAQSALDLTWAELERRDLVKANEKLGALALIKRLAGQARAEIERPIPGLEGFPSTTRIAANDVKSAANDVKSAANDVKSADNAFEGKDVRGYLAVLHMDGDRMGALLSHVRSLDAHRMFSDQLARAGRDGVERVMQGFPKLAGRVVYTGGDDVLALLPLRHALAIAVGFRKVFDTIEVQDEAGQPIRLTASAGIAITPHDLPLDRALDLAREAEERAKEDYGRNALVVVEAHGTGQMRSAGGKWDLIPLIMRFQTLFAENKLSGKFGYDLLSINRVLFDDDLKDARAAEVQRLARRRTKETADYERDVQAAVEDLIAIADGTPDKGASTWGDLAHWIILARFLAQDFLKQEQEAPR